MPKHPKGRQRRVHPSKRTKAQLRHHSRRKGPALKKTVGGPRKSAMRSTRRALRAKGTQKKRTQSSLKATTKKGTRKPSGRDSTPRNAPRVKYARRINDHRFQAALKRLQEGKRIGTVAKEIGVSPKRLEWHLLSTGAARKHNGRWLVRANLPRQILLFSRLGAFIVLPRNRYQASKGARFMSAAGRALRSNEPTEVEAFEGRSLTDTHGRKWFFETNLDVLYRLASTGSEPFEAIYRIVI